MSNVLDVKEVNEMQTRRKLEGWRERGYEAVKNRCNLSFLLTMTPLLIIGSEVFES